MNNTKFLSKIGVLLLTALLITACGGKAAKKTADTAANGKASNDITRPPSFVERDTKPEAESNPDETISYDEWRKRRESAGEQVDTGSSDSVELEDPVEPTKIP